VVGYAIQFMQCTNYIMRLMTDVLHHYLDSFFIVYLDDILVYSATWAENISHLMHVLETLKKK
jgi:hypothetical protein